MISKWRWLLGQLGSKLWLRAALFALVGIVTALLGVAADAFLPPETPELVGADAVGTVLNVLASSMLAVTTFSLGATVSAYSSATSNVTPRATKLLMQDSSTQTVLSTFIGSFLFSLVGIVTLTIEGYGQRGRLVLFVVTIGVIVIVVAALLHWIDHLSRLGRVQETSARVEDAATEAIARRAGQPSLGGRQVPVGFTPHPDALRVPATRTGYVQFVDTQAIERAVAEAGQLVELRAIPGTYVVAGDTIATVGAVAADPDAERLVEAVQRGFGIGNERTFEQDPRFGILVLAEVASRALSAAVNDSGTAIDVIGRLQRVLVRWAEVRTAGEEEDVPCPHVLVPALLEKDLFEDAFMTIARDGADKLEVQLRLHKALVDLSGRGDLPFREAARMQRLHALEEAERGLHFEREKQRVREIARA